jgi:hypothetical protein
VSIRVAFCCNDERGLFTERVEAVDFHDARGFEARVAGPALVLRFDAKTKDQVKVGRRIFAIAEGSRRYGVGNWCWDGARMSQREAVRLLEYLLERGYQAEEWTTSGGPFVGAIEASRRRAS